MMFKSQNPQSDQSSLHDFHEGQDEPPAPHFLFDNSETIQLLIKKLSDFYWVDSYPWTERTLP
jgi:hypothetical protein